MLLVFDTNRYGMRDRNDNQQVFSENTHTMRQEMIDRKTSSTNLISLILKQLTYFVNKQTYVIPIIGSG